jgi:putative beta-barrel porin BBP2
LSLSIKGPFPPGTSWIAVLGCFLTLALGGSARAQTYYAVGEGLTVGHFIFYPSLVNEYSYDSNILYMPTDEPGLQPIDSGVIVLRARIMADLPIGNSRIQWIYAPFYRNYTSDQFTPEDRINQVFALQGVIHTGGATTITVRDDYVNGTFNLQQQQFSQNGLTYGLGHYSTHDPRVELAWNLGARHGVSILPSYSRSEYSGTNSGNTQFINYGYTTHRLEGRYNYRLDEPTTMYGYYAGESTLQHQAGVPDITIHSRSVGLGLTRTVNELVVTQISAGYQTMNFDGGNGQNFFGPIAQANVTWQLAEATVLNLELLRKPYASVYSIYNYYLATEAGIRLTRQLGRSTYVELGTRLMADHYIPAEGVGRRDRVIRVDAGMGHQFMSHLRGYAGVNLEDRDSNVMTTFGGENFDPFRYQVRRILFRFEVGWM